MIYRSIFVVSSKELIISSAALAELEENNKTQINLLTLLAEDYASVSPRIVKVIEDTLFKV